MNHIEIQREYHSYLTQMGYGEGTVQSLPKYLREFLYCIDPKDLQSVTQDDILNYRAYLSHRPNLKKPGGLSGIHIDHHTYALKVFFGWKEIIGEIEGSPLTGLELERSTSKPRDILTRKEIKELYEVADPLERALLGLFYGCGLRVSEGCDLETKDVHLRSQLVYVRKGKGGKRRAVPMSEQVRDDLKAYFFYERPKRVKESNEFFLLNTRGGKMRRPVIYHQMRKLEMKTNIPLVTPHVLRHSIATHLLENGLPVEQVRDFLGHKHLESTQVYTHLSKL